MECFCIWRFFGDILELGMAVNQVIVRPNHAPGTGRGIWEPVGSDCPPHSWSQIPRTRWERTMCPFGVLWFGGAEYLKDIPSRMRSETEVNGALRAEDTGVTRDTPSTAPSLHWQVSPRLGPVVRSLFPHRCIICSSCPNEGPHTGCFDNRHFFSLVLQTQSPRSWCPRGCVS